MEKKTLSKNKTMRVFQKYGEFGRVRMKLTLDQILNKTQVLTDLGELCESV